MSFFMKKSLWPLVLLLFSLYSCASDEEEDSTPYREPVRESITEPSGAFEIKPPSSRRAETYPWRRHFGDFPVITKEFFRCKGSPLSATRIEYDDAGEAVRYSDCIGGTVHSLPLRGESEFVYPILIDILNYLQETTGKRVVITCGHRCPTHNSYADSSKYNSTSKHMVAAEVDFYVEGMEDNPWEIVDRIFAYYKDDSLYGREWQEFQRYEKSDTNVSTKPWYNKELFVKLFKEDEGRDLDNSHPYPYIGIQVRYDRDTQERVYYNWDRAHRGFLRS